MNERGHGLHRVAAWVALALTTGAMFGCGGYGPVSRNAYDYATALYSATNRKAADKIEEIGGRIEADRAAGRLTPEEAEWLGEIVADAREGDWPAAAAACRALMEDQAQE